MTNATHDWADIDWLRALTLGGHYRALMSGLDPRHVAIIEARILPATPTATLEDLGKTFGVTRERMRQLEPGARAAFAALSGEHLLAMADRALELLDRLGPIADTRSTRFCELLAQCVRDVEPTDRDSVAGLLVRMAGYEDRAGWLVHATAGWPTRYEFMTYGPFRWSEVHTELLLRGLHPTDIASWLETEKAMVLRDVLVAQERSVVDNCHALLTLAGEPMTAEALLAELGSSRSARAVRWRLMDDERFVRTSKAHFGLAIWNVPAYAGIAESMAKVIVEHGGEMLLTDLVAVMGERYDAAPASVRTYAGAYLFARDGGSIRVRGKRERIELDPSVIAAGVAARTGPTTFQLVVNVDHNVLRGSGDKIGVGLGVALGVTPGGRREFRHAGGSLLVSWPMTAFMGPSRGTVRELATHAGAETGDVLELTFDVAAGTVTGRRQHSSEIASRTASVARTSSSL